MTGRLSRICTCYNRIRIIYVSSCLLNSLSFCSTSNSNLSTLYWSASLRCLNARALSLAPSSNILPFPALILLLLLCWTFLSTVLPLPLLLLLLLLLPLAARSSAPTSRPACSSARALSVSMRRAWRSSWRVARSRRRVTEGPISSRSEASAACRVGWGMSS